MPRHTPRLFTRLRRHRGVWVLALAVLLFKVAMSTFCVLDGPGLALAGDPAVKGVVAGASIDIDDDYCVLDEGNGCHCSCAHAVALPSHDVRVPLMATLSYLAAPLPPALSPAIARSPLRPPIA